MSMIFSKEAVMIMVAGIVTENLIFARALGVDRISERTRSYRDILRFCTLYCGVTLLACSLACGFRYLLSKYAWWNTVRGLVVLICIIAAYFVPVLIAGPNRVNAYSMPVTVAFNGASFGAVFIAVSSMNTVGSALIYCLSCSLGLAAAMLLIHAGRERMELCSVPRAFSGIPITMIYIGILGLAIYGLVGHQLPT